MQAIEVKFLPVTANKPDRYKAFCQTESLTESTSSITDALIKKKIPIRSDNSAKYLAEKLAYMLNWTGPNYGRLIMGELKNGNYVFVFTVE